jgi:hypothetical protein
VSVAGGRVRLVVDFSHSRPDHRRGDESRGRSDHPGVIRVADLFELPGAADVLLRCTNLRTLSGKRPVFADDSAAVFYFPFLHIRFIEIPPRSLGGTDLPMPVEVGVPSVAETDGAAADDPEADLEIDEDFLRRIREA